AGFESGCFSGRFTIAAISAVNTVLSPLCNLLFVEAFASAVFAELSFIEAGCFQYGSELGLATPVIACALSTTRHDSSFTSGLFEPITQRLLADALKPGYGDDGTVFRRQKLVHDSCFALW